MTALHPLLAVASAVWSRSSTLVVLMLLARLLPPDEFGAFTLVQLVLGIVAALVSGGDMWLNRFARLPGHGRLLALAQGAYVLIGAGAAAVLLLLGFAVIFLTPLAANYASTAALGLVAGTLAGMGEIALAVLRSQDRVVSFFALRDFAVSGSFLLLLGLVRPRHADLVFVIFGGIWLATLAALLLAGRFGVRLRAAAAKMAGWPRRLFIAAAIRHTAGVQYGNLSARLAYLDVFVLSTLIPIAEIGEFRTAAQLAIGFVVVQHFVFLSLPWQLREVGRTARKGRGADQVAAHQLLLLLLAGLALVLLFVFATPILLLFGARFAGKAWVFQAMLLIRFAGLLWGPQHEILISNGRVASDAHANLLVLAVWPAVFLGAWGLVGPMRAAVIATALADAGVQFARAILIRRSELHLTRGHPLGAALPLAATLAVVIFVAAGA